MKLTCVLPYEKARWSAALVRPSVYSGESVVVEKPGHHVTIGFNLGAYDVQEYGFGHLCTRPAAITAANVDAILKLLTAPRPNKGPVLAMDKLPTKWEAPVVDALLAAKGWSADRENHDMLDDQEGWGFMGGTGCGHLVHKLLFTKVLGPRAELTGVRRTLAAMQFNGWLGQVKDIREANKHLRDAVAEDQLFVTYNARPICQSTVRYRSARGFTLKAVGQDKCTCTKCAKKLGIPVARRK